MEHFLGYHNAENRGPYFPDEKSKRSTTGKFFTAKYRPETLIGNKIWVIEGRKDPRQYRIVSTGTITNVVRERTPEQKNDLTIDFSVDEFNDPIEVTSFDWFRKLLSSQQDFRYGFTQLSDPNNIKEIEAAWSGRGTVASNPALADIDNISSDKTADLTTKRRLIDARLGQGRFGDQLEERWENACAVTGCKISSVLRASHIKAWRNSSNEERLDPNNGLLLAAHIDALFNSGLVTFRDDGRMIVSEEVPPKDKRILQLGQSLSKKLTNGEKRFLRHHRESIFQDNR